MQEPQILGTRKIRCKLKDTQKLNQDINILIAIDLSH
jgi:hypothetical protein